METHSSQHLSELRALKKLTSFDFRELFVLDANRPASRTVSLMLCHASKTGILTISPPLCLFKRFTQSMKLDKEMDRLTLEHGTMLGPPTEEERAEEMVKKQLTNKVGHSMGIPL